MSDFLPKSSTQYAIWGGNISGLLVESDEWASKVRASHARLAVTKAGFTTAAGNHPMIRLPGGKIRVWKHLSFLITAGTPPNPTANLSIGLGAYIQGGSLGADDGAGGTAAMSVAASAGVLLNAITYATTQLVGSLVDLLGLSPDDPDPVELDTKSGVDVTLDVSGAAVGTDAVFDLLIAYQVGN